MRIIHCADIHLESPMNTRFTDKVAKERKSEILAGFIEMVRYAAANGVGAIIIAGDLFDKEKVSKRISDIMINVIENNREIDFYYLRGNHDKGRWIEALDYVPDNLLLFNESFISYIANDKGKGNIVITGIEKKCSNDSVYEELKLDESDYNILVMHGNVVDTNVEHNAEDISLRRLAGKNIDYLAMGHLHSYSEGKLDSRGSFCYSGCLMARGFDECGEHGFVLIDIDENTLNVSRRFVKMSGREVYIKYVDVSGCSDNNEAEEKVKRDLDEDGISSKSIVRVILCGKAGHGCDVDADILMSWLDKEYYYIEVADELKRTDQYEDEENEDISLTSTLKGEFIRLVKERKDITSEDKQAIIRYGLMALDGEDITGRGCLSPLSESVCGGQDTLLRRGFNPLRSYKPPADGRDAQMKMSHKSCDAHLAVNNAGSVIEKVRIKRCYIENFGKLHRYECNLSDGCNVIYRPNGWGKSTLTVFLRVMFYGFEGEGRKDDVSNERRRYNPWQGGVYGGEVSFEVNGKGYIIKRTFGNRKKEDEFKLYDAVTMLESSDYTCNIGEELFGIDSRSFLKTVYISEKVCMTSATDVIAAKLAGGRELLPDVSNYDKADTVLANEINRLSPDRKTGALYKINRKMTEQKSIFVKKEYVNEELDRLNSGANKLKDRVYFDKLLIILLVCAGACLGAGLAALYNQYDKGLYSLAAGCLLLLVSILYWKVRRVLLMKKIKNEKSDAEDETVGRIRRTAELEKKLEAIDRAEKTYAELERQYEVYSKKYELLMKTRELLNEAKISFGVKYMPDINECFDKYYAMLNNMHNTSYGINANMELFAKKKGMYRDISLLSAGKKDIAGLCFRMALIGSMYKGERPFLILDDPFVNMDDESVLHAMEFTKIISREYQVIYFTCHRSRCIE